MTKKYITTAIPYVNGNPHVGHTMDYLLSDTFYRYLKLSGEDARFQSGTDEHGNKIFHKALDSKKDINEYIDENSQKFRDFIQKLGVFPTDFIRTSDKNHERRCQEIWKKLEPHIYSAELDCSLLINPFLLSQSTISLNLSRRSHG